MRPEDLLATLDRLFFKGGYKTVNRGMIERAMAETPLTGYVQLSADTSKLERRQIADVSIDGPKCAILEPCCGGVCKFD